MNTAVTTPRLTSLSHGGGCGCKISPAILAELLRGSAAAVPRPAAHAALLVGTETGDDAAVYQLSDTHALIATTDFFMPIVDDPFDFGRIAATNALSDVYAMGGRPIFALALLAMPVNVLPAAVIREILRGGEAVCAAAGIPIAGGHSIDSIEPIYGLAALGLVHPSHVQRNSGARAGDALILGKPLGVGVLSAALKKGALTPAGYRQLIDTTTRLNSAGPDLAVLAGVHAMTDVTGFGLLGHLLGMCRGARLGARLCLRRLPEIDGVRPLLAAGYVTGASARNWASYGDDVRLAPELSPLDQALLCDPQTSGGLLIACAPEAIPAALRILEREGFGQAAVIGEMTDGAPTAAVEP